MRSRPDNTSLARHCVRAMRFLQPQTIRRTRPKSEIPDPEFRLVGVRIPTLRKSRKDGPRSKCGLLLSHLGSGDVSLRLCRRSHLDAKVTANPTFACKQVEVLEIYHVWAT